MHLKTICRDNLRVLRRFCVRLTARSGVAVLSPAKDEEGVEGTAVGMTVIGTHSA